MDRIPSGKAAKTFGELADRASRGERIMITRYGKDYALLCPPPMPEPGEIEKDEKDR